MAARRYVVALSRIDFSVKDTGVTYEQIVLGPYRSKEKAERRAATIKRLAEKYEEPEGCLDVVVEPLRRGSMSAQDALDHLYGSMDEDDE